MRERERERETDRQTDRETETETDRQTEKERKKMFISSTEVLCNVMAVTAQSCLLILRPCIQENGI